MQTPQQRDKGRFQQLDIVAVLRAKEIPHPWVVAKKSISGRELGGAWFAALVPVASVQQLIRDGGSWDLHIGDGAPSVWTTRHEDGSTVTNYCRFGNERGIEPLVLIGNSIGSQPSPVEISQEFKLFHRLVEDRTNSKFVKIGSDGNESDAVRIIDGNVEIRSDLLLQYCSAKEMALALYVDSAVYSRFELLELDVEDSSTENLGLDFVYSLSTRNLGGLGDEDKRSISRLLGKKYVLPPAPLENESGKELFQEFIIDSLPTGELIKETCDPELLADFFGKNKGRPNYLTPVFFRLEVLAKYYSDPVRYEVDDGAIHCHGNWTLRLDNDNDNYVCVWLGDLGRDLSESERNYWLSFNIPPDGRNISKTCYERAIRANFADPTRPDLLFKNSYKYFSRDFLKKEGWPFFLELHDADQHSFQSLHGLLSENGSEFDDQLINLAKLLVDSLNESKLVEGRSTVDKDEKGITKLEKFFVEKGFSNFEPYVVFLRKLQRLRSLSAAHRKGGNYDKANKEFGLSEDGFKRAFDGLLAHAHAFVEYLRSAFGL